MENLSERDRAVLNVIFDPSQAHGPLDFSKDESLDTVDQQPEEDALSEDVVELVKEAISCAESQRFDESFRLFEEASKKAPLSASILNDRAQALRLAARDDEALKDLNAAVKLSRGKGKAGVRALCQRGILYRYMNEDRMAKEDFTLAAEAGSSFARSQLVSLNPYAAMCNAMLREITLKSNRH